MKPFAKNLWLAWSVLAGASAQAQNAEEKLAFSNRRTLIPSLVSSPNGEKACDDTLIDKLENAGQLPNGSADSIFMPRDFIKALCVFHGKAISVTQKEALIETFQKKVSINLQKQQKQAADLYEAVLHCQVASSVMIADKIPQGDLDVTRFCAHRRMAKEALGAIDWAGLHLEYEKPTTSDSMDGLMNQISQCGKLVLADSNDTGCGQLTALSLTTLETIADGAARDTMAHYFDVVDSDNGPKTKGQIAPYSAMLARKVAMTEDTIARSAENFAALHTRNEKLTESIFTLSALYGTWDGKKFDATADYPATVAAMQKDYLDAINRGQTLYALAQKWEAGLYTSDTGGRENFLKDLTTRQADIQGQKEIVEGAKTLASQEKSLGTQVGEMLTLIQSLGPKRDENGQKITRSLCALYYCEIRGKGNADKHKSACSTFVPNKSQYIYEINPLCEVSESKIAGVLEVNKQQKKLKDICEAAAFPSKYILASAAAMANVDTNACMTDSQAFDKTTLAKISGS